MNRHPNLLSPRNDRHAFTLVELLVVIGIIALLISILLPALGRARQQAATVKCLSNLRQFGAAIAMYANDNKGFLVPGAVRKPGDTFETENWATILVNAKYITAPTVPADAVQEINNQSGSQSNVFRCPAGIDQRFNVTGNTTLPTRFDTNTGRQFTRQLSISSGVRIDNWYGINGWSANDTALNIGNAFKRWAFTMVPGGLAASPQRLHKIAEFKDSTRLVLIFDGLGFHQQKAYAVSARHNGGKITNMLFADGHCASVPVPGDLPMKDEGANGWTLKKFTNDGPRFLIDDVP